VLTPPGTIVAWAGFGPPPEGWLVCDGSTFSATAYPELSMTLGSTTVPDLRGRVIVGLDFTSARITSGLASVIGGSGGTDMNFAVPSHTHSIPSDPGHTHTLTSACNNSTCNNGNDGFTRGSGNLDGSAFRTAPAGSHNHGGSTGPTGANGVTNLQPFLTLRYLIKT
ncbi:MAG: tail fiber protein, partial [Myxococcaceae bacterium]|nr:tail fiber protein [Myxococcaceae bacterium]